MSNCAKCGSAEMRVRRANDGAHGMNQLPLGKGRPASVALDNLVCTSCGDAEFFVSDEASLTKIADTWDRP